VFCVRLLGYNSGALIVASDSESGAFLPWADEALHNKKLGGKVQFSRKRQVASNMMSQR
jgi:hypothetical protein